MWWYWSQYKKFQLEELKVSVSGGAREKGSSSLAEDYWFSWPAWWDHTTLSDICTDNFEKKKTKFKKKIIIVPYSLAGHNLVLCYSGNFNPQLSQCPAWAPRSQYPSSVWDQPKFPSHWPLSLVSARRSSETVEPPFFSNLLRRANIF